MKPEQQRIAIAQACGWKWVRLRQQEGLCDDVRGYPPNVECVGLNERYAPDYLNDLNAMHEAEKIMSYDEFDEYYVQLSMKMVRPFHATAAQRAEAFLKTLNLWKP